MKKNFIVYLLLISISYSCSSLTTDGKKVRYFDENNTEITKSKFARLRSTNQLLDIPGDSSNHKKLIVREFNGKIDDRLGLQNILEENLNINLDSQKPIVILFYPGMDSCNSTGRRDRIWINEWYGELEKGLLQIADVTPIYLYKRNDGLANFEGLIEWKKDPNGVIEDLFFEHHYPCKSFVVIDKDGNYIGYLGAFQNQRVLIAAEALNKS